jgi:ankyrin repeat protein
MHGGSSLNLPERPHWEHLKKQAKQLLRLYRDHDSSAFTRFRESLPSAAGKDDDALISLQLRLHDAQSCVAREYGYPSWADLRAAVEWRASQFDAQTRLIRWLVLVYGGDIFAGYGNPRPAVAAKLLAEMPDLPRSNPYLACAACDDVEVRRAILDGPAWVTQPSPSLKLPPLVAVTLSSLAGLPEMRAHARRCVELLLEAGADPNQLWKTDVPRGLSPLYGAAGRNHDAGMTTLLLSAGANPNDGESLYHSVEGRDLTCTRLLLEAGAFVEGSNSLHHLLDREDPDGVRLLLSHTKNADDPESPLGTPLLWAIRRRRSVTVIKLLLDAGANPMAKTRDGISAYCLAWSNGLTEVASLLAEAGAGEAVSEDVQFVAACARADATNARRLQRQRPDLPRALSETQLRQLPNLMEAGGDAAVRLMVELGWPLDVRGGDWNATALNLAVFQGNAALARFLLEHGASWTETHGYGDNVCGTLSFASCNHTGDPAGPGDWLGCAEALVEHGMPGATPIASGDPWLAEHVSIAGTHKRFSEEVTEFLLAVGGKTSPGS